MNIAIVGVGLVGRILALNILNKSHNVTMYDEDIAYGDAAAGYTAAGMLAFFAELETAESSIFEKGKKSIELWPSLLEQIGIPEAFKNRGSIITAHSQDLSELDHFIQILRVKVPEASLIQELNNKEIIALEPDLEQHNKAFYIPSEGSIDTHLFMKTSSDYLLSHDNVTWFQEQKIDDFNILKENFDWVYDSRGLGAQKDIKDLRGVRGEVFWLDAPDVKITRPIRMLHPRYKIYIVPQANNIYIIGATEIESEDKSPMSVLSSLELLSAVYSMHSGFSEARIIKTLTNCRPALKDNLPCIEYEDKLTRINGLYRHGYLLAPAVVSEALSELK